MRVDFALKTRPSFWETPRNLVIIGIALTGVVATLAGYRLAQAPAQTIVIQLPPGYAVSDPAPSK